MAVNYEDERFQQVTREQDQAIKNVENTYNNMINQSRDLYEQQAKEAERYGQEQAQIQQANTDFAIQEIEKQKDRAQQDYTKQQKGAYADYQEQINPYGANAEAMAHLGLRGSGYSETSIRSMYNQYQARVASANEAYQRAVQDYDSDITQARLTNNAQLAQIAYDALQAKLSINLEGFQYQNKLIQEQLNAMNQEKDRYYSRWKDVLSQVNYENEMAEQQRQFNAQIALQRESMRNSGNGGNGEYILSEQDGNALTGGEQTNVNINGQRASEPVKKYNGKTYIPVDGMYADNGSPIYKLDNKLYYWNGTDMIFGGNATSSTPATGSVNKINTSKSSGLKSVASGISASNLTPYEIMMNLASNAKKKESEMAELAKSRTTGSNSKSKTKQRLSR